MIQFNMAMLAVVVAAPAPPDPVSEAVAELQGTWALVSFEVKGGKPIPDTTSTTITIKGKELSLRKRTTDPRKYTYTVDPVKSPAHLDLTFVGETGVCHAIYRLEKGELMICAGTNLEPDEASNRPREFTTGLASDRPPKGNLILIFKRVK